VISTARYVLGVDTAGRLGSVALAEEGSATAWETLAPGEHSSGLSRAAGRILEKRNLGWRDVTGIAVSSGPGSFTGLRIGLAWAKGVCFGSSAKLLLVSAHEANAYRHRLGAGLIATVLSGERGEVQSALWSGGQGLERLWGPERVPELDLAKTLLEAASSHVLAGARGRLGSGRPGIAIAGPDLAPELRRSLEEAGYVTAAVDALPPTAAAVAELGHRYLLDGREESLAQAAPSYGRAPNARKPSP
jgi:tRNA threonylcarbamoyladenosine biosynthesis protein TsaB